MLSCVRHEMLIDSTESKYSRYGCCSTPLLLLVSLLVCIVVRTAPKDYQSYHDEMCRNRETHQMPWIDFSWCWLKETLH
jgi:hypothetical protein